MSRIRPFRPGDEAALARVCLLTADAGADATGVLVDEDLWGEVFVLPYVARHPEFAFVVETDDGRVAGYVVGAPDTRAFEGWFASEWWPRFAERWPRPAGERTRQDGVLIYAYGRGPGVEPYGDTHPAHLHIDLLPELQGQGWGRRLIDTLSDALRAQGVAALHLVASADNTGALAFYDRLGFERVPSHDGVQVFARSL
ncbi:GNAT family N-acetyltransferase [Microbacterium sp. Sa4CUA7]|uniref:GNAT family N-acetyltransferase n=1 Tax=Microbacterium pullorum TaxID=2762236 RepID=A0ABR8RY77_9MICO|nr:GNAT family N-acetyltransferase [Microbacterium pullorum]MBD7956201.1 GNAT family N-acetyltransferase [Microbacterium pullorum]